MKQTISISFFINEIIYDIQNKSYLTGKSRSDGTNQERVAAMQANDDTENADQIMRSITAAWGILRTHLSEYIEGGSANIDNSPSGDSELRLKLVMPSNFNNGVGESIVAAAHDYIVSKALYDWFVITDKEDADDYARAAERALAAISVSSNKRVRPKRKTDSGAEA